MIKIELMHKIFGRDAGRKCKNCSNITRGYHSNTRVTKCKIYGNTLSEATDWVNNYVACGMFNKEYTETPIIELKKHYKKEVESKPMQGQMELKEEIK